jgi:hypothetical protein
MMQETYSSGDFIAAEMGIYFATTVDRDYLNQGSNISVLSRYPIKELYVQADSPFMNVAVKVAVSKKQDLYVMSNWYGMQQFPAVFEFYESRFKESNVIPTLFAGDFNAVPHTDNGDSPVVTKVAPPRSFSLERGSSSQLKHFQDQGTSASLSAQNS